MSGRHQRRQRGLFFQFQSVRRDMVGFQRHSPGQGFPPAVHALPRQTKHQVHTDIFEPGASDQPNSLHRFRRLMDSADAAQHLIIKTLHAEAQSVETRLSQRLQRIGVHCARIGFQTDFSIIRQRKRCPQRLQYSRQISGRQQRRRTAAKKHRVRRHGEIAARCGDFPAESGDIGMLDRRVTDLRHKRAITAFGPAERNMNVDSQGTLRHPAQSRFKTAMNASCGSSTLPTCFMRFFPSFCFSSSLRFRVMSPP